MYQKYYTEGLVLGSREVGEADRVYTLFTRDFGLVRARASAVRTHRSRMRYALQNYSRVTAALIKGKRGWRLGGAVPRDPAAYSIEGKKIFARIAELVLRLVRGEEKNEYLFSALAEAHRALARAEKSALPTIEIVCVARVLYALGYLSAEAHATTIFAHTAYSLEHLEEAEGMRDELLSSINKAIAETQL